MNVPTRTDHSDRDPLAYGVELTDEELNQVVGGLDRGWWPEPDDIADQQRGY